MSTTLTFGCLFCFVSENIMTVPAPPPAQVPPKNEDILEIVSISDDEENAALVKLNGGGEKCELPSSKQKETTTAYSIIDAAIKTTDTSFVLEPVREEQPRPNKLSRSRAPLNQSKSKDSKNLLMSLDAPSSATNNYSSNSNNSSEIMSHRAFENGAYASAMLSSSIPSSFSQSQNSSNGTGHSSSSNNNSSKNDGNLLPLNRLDSIMRSTTQDTSSTTRSASTMPTQQSAVTSFANNVNSIEPELVLSPAKLGQ